MKTAIVTGANRGIGAEVARGLAQRGYQVVLLGRNLRGLQERAEEIAAASRDARIWSLECDLAVQSSVERAVHTLNSRLERLDVLVHNAGATFAERLETVDHFERTLAVDVLGPLRLTLGVIHLLEASGAGRVVQLAGRSYRSGKLDLGDLHFKQRAYSRWAANAQAQQARVMVGLELAERLASRHITVNMVHPGAVLTDAVDEAGWGPSLLAHTLLRPGFVRPELGAEPVLRLAASDEVNGLSGTVFRRMEVDSLAENVQSPGARRSLLDTLLLETHLKWPHD